MKLQDIPSIETASVGRSSVRFQWPLVSWNRSQFLRAAVGTGMAIGVSSLGVFPPARKALASHVGSEGYEIRESCAQDLDETCAVPCKPSMIYPNACYTDPGHHYLGWHRHGCTLAYGVAWRLRQNQCDPNYFDWDGWKWSVSNCENCSTAVFRCHDGYICDVGFGCDLSNCDNSVCKKRISC